MGRVRVDRDASAIAYARIIRRNRHTVQQAVEVGLRQGRAAKKQMPPARQIGRGRGQPAPGPFHSGVPEQTTLWVGRAFRQTEAIVGRDIPHGKTGKILAVRGKCAGQCKRIKKTPAQKVSVALARDLLDHKAQQDISGIAIGPCSARVEKRLHPQNEVHKIVWLNDPAVLYHLCPCGLECRQMDMVGQPCAVVQQVVDGHAVAIGQPVEPRAIPKVRGQRITARKASLGLQHQDCRGDEGLADAGRQHGCRGCHGASGLDIREAGGRGHDRSIRQRNRRCRPRKAVAVLDLLHRHVQLCGKSGHVPRGGGL